MKKILIPTDFSKNAWNAIDYAMHFLKEERCTFYFLHTYTPAFYRMDYVLGGPAFSAIPDVGVDVSLAGLEKTLSDVKKKYPNPKHLYEQVSSFNILTDEIQELSEKMKFDLIIMGTQGATGAAEIFLGSNTVYVIRKAKVPILAIPGTYHYKNIKKVLFPTDYWTQYESAALDTVIQLVKTQKAALTVFHVKEEYDLSPAQLANKTHLELALKQIKPNFEEQRGAYMPEAIIEYADTHGYDFLIMMNRQHSFLERLLLRQNVDQIGFHTKIPFMVIRDMAKISK